MLNYASELYKSQIGKCALTVPYFCQVVLGAGVAQLDIMYSEFRAHQCNGVRSVR